MAKGFKHGGGGGSASSALNFKIVGGTAQPSGAAENTIWVNTAEEITSWMISPGQPENPGQGAVWIEAGLVSEAAFNALKKNGILVCPIGAKQYIDGAWANKEAQIFLDGAWVSFSTEAVYLYLPGDVCEAVTGGYVAEAMSAASSTSAKAAPTVTEGASAMEILPSKSTSNTAYRGGVVRTANKIDCSGYSSLIFEGTVEGIGTGNGKLCLWSDMGTVQTDNRERYADLANGSEPITVDISDLTGSYYIGFGFDSMNVQITVTMTELRLE